MLRHALCVLAGAYLVQLLPQLPGPAISALIILLALPALLSRNLRMCALVVLGFGSLAIAAQQELDQQLSPKMVGNNIQLTGQVIEFTHIKRSNSHITVAPEPGQGLPGKIVLRWFDAPVAPGLGESWRFEVRLKPPRGYANPGGYDYEKWLHRQRVGASGYVVQSSSPAIQLDRKIAIVSKLRRQVVARLDQLLPADDARAVLKAITIGSRVELSGQHWDLFGRTGTSHLMAISGLHIGLAASAAFGLSWCVLIPFMPRRNLRDAALLLASAAAFAYAQLSGLGVPAMRAFLMLMIGTWAVLWRRRMSGDHLIGVTCMLAFLVDPLLIYAPGFVLSFVAVALLIWRAQQGKIAILARDQGWRARTAVATRELAALQWVLLFGMAPFTAIIFGRIAVLAPVANLLVLPVFSLVVLPAGLLGLMLDGPLAPIGDLLLRLSHIGIDTSLAALKYVEYLPVSRVELPSQGGMLAFVVAASLLMAILPPGWPGRYIAVISLLATFFVRPDKVPSGCADVVVLDVGQGLAVIVETRERTLLYDTGPAFRTGTSTAELVIKPYLAYRGIQRIDRLIVSHADLDHAGGLDWLRTEFEIGQVISGESTELAVGPCFRGQRWQWNGVEFRVLHPESSHRWTGNDASCVLEVKIGEKRVLLPGDIEIAAERALLYAGELGNTSLVVVPHHGSRTSSGIGLVEALSPEYAVVSAGYENRWGFPKEDVVARWNAAGSTVLTTAAAGAISRRYCIDRPAGPIAAFRSISSPYWRQ